MIKYIYAVHSDINENNIYKEFDNIDEAIDYAKTYAAEETFVTEAEVEVIDDEIVNEFGSDIVWAWDWAQEEAPVAEEDDGDPFKSDFDDYEEDELISSKSVFTADYDTDDLEDLEELFDVDVTLPDINIDARGQSVGIAGGTDGPIGEELIKESGIQLKSREETEEFFRLCKEIGLETPTDLHNFAKDMDVEGKDLLQVLRDYRAELGPDFRIEEEIDFDDLVEELEENEDMVECKECFDLVAKESCHKNKEGKYVCEKCSKTLAEESIESDQVLVGTDNAVVDCEVADVVTHSEDEKPVNCKCENKPLSKPLTESSLVKGNYEISPTEHLSWGWDKGDTFYVEKTYRASENEQIWNTEFRRTYATTEDAEKAFKRYVKKYSVLTEDALDWELEKVEIDVDSLEETDAEVIGECTVYGNLETFGNTKEPTEDDARFNYDKTESTAEVKGLSTDFTESEVDKIERIVARDVRLNLKKN